MTTICERQIGQTVTGCAPGGQKKLLSGSCIVRFELDGLVFQLIFRGNAEQKRGYVLCFGRSKTERRHSGSRVHSVRIQQALDNRRG